MSAEVVVTLGVLLLLLVVHQLWWTNREARADAGRTVQSLQREWDEPAPAPAPAPDPGGGEGALDAGPPPSASGRAAEAAPGPDRKSVV